MPAPDPSDPHPHLWFPFTYHDDLAAAPPLVIDRGEGVWLYDRDGRAWLDAVGSWWTSLLGHRRPEIVRAVEAQLGRLEHVMMAGFVTEPVLGLAERLARRMPPELGRFFLSDNGSTAVEVALKMALQHWELRGEERPHVIALGGAYHGDTLGAMSVGDIPAYHATFHRLWKGGLFTDPPSCYRCPVGREPMTCAAQCMDSLERLLDAHRGRVAAVIFEPMVQGVAGMRVYPARVLERVFELCERHGVLTIADEVAMGMGRTGRFLATEHSGRVPDIACLAKGLTGGFLPLAVTAVKEHVYAPFRGAAGSGRILHHGHTFTGNPLAAAAACATLDVLEALDLPAALAPLSERFARQLQTFRDIEAVGDIRHLGLVGALELVSDRQTRAPLDPEARIPWRIHRRALDLGLVLRPLGDVLYFMPPLTITAEELDLMLTRARTAIEDVLT
ncbi:MAG: adenosylmethionine--8-amino-7-oxononanoate transaminase [Deltaproteobacteria bacterium]|nr:adenosylmethionine--8-amino-7-oxononanoate transaminase [Deltaproteobacteria bacterium]